MAILFRQFPRKSAQPAGWANIFGLNVSLVHGPVIYSVLIILVFNYSTMMITGRSADSKKEKQNRPEWMKSLSDDEAKESGNDPRRL